MDIKAVIDWEFCGTKPEIYDLANLIGPLSKRPDISIGEDPSGPGTWH